MRRKVRLTFPKLVQEVLEIDKDYFDLKNETICNLIIEGLGFKGTIEIGFDSLDEKRSISINLNEKNSKYLPDMLQMSKIKEESEFLRSIFKTYANLHPSNRERVLYQNIFLKVEQAIIKKKKIKFYYKDKLYKAIPLALERGENGYNCLRVKIEDKEYLYEMKNIEDIV